MHRVSELHEFRELGAGLTAEHGVLLSDGTVWRSVHVEPETEDNCHRGDRGHPRTQAAAAAYRGRGMGGIELTFGMYDDILVCFMELKSVSFRAQLKLQSSKIP